MGCRGGSGAGSSPLARGLRVGSACASRRRRIIPARAGFTTLGTRNPWHRGDHPRSRGVYPTKSGEFAQDQGSSPLARGLRPCVASRSAWSRIIPARAGFTGVQGPASARRRDHPRSRGVYSSALADLLAAGGSSPLARGLPDHVDVLGVGRGIIPARAGFTRGKDQHPRSPEDHPRSRGVYSSCPPPSSLRQGSSPLARGLRLGAGARRLVAGIIPARAGFTLADPWNPNDE